MNKIKSIFIVLLVFVLSGCTKSAVTPLTIAPTSTPVVKLLTWSDPAGFTFEYPEGVIIDNHPQDSKNYANLTLTFPNNSQVDIIMADKAPTSLLKNKNIIDTTLGGKTAQKYIENGKTTLYCEDNDVSVTISGVDISTVVDTWVFVYPTPSVGKAVVPAVSDDSGDVLEEF